MGGQVVRAVCGVRQAVGVEYEPGVLDGAHREDDPGVIGHPQPPTAGVDRGDPATARLEPDDMAVGEQFQAAGAVAEPFG